MIVYFAVLGIVLTAAGPNGLDLDAGQTSAWIALLYGWPTLLALVLTIRYRQPLLLTGNIFAIIFFVTLGDRLTFPSSPAPRSWRARSCCRSLLGVTDRIGAWMPQIVQGLIAGVVLPFVVNVFTALSTSEHGNELPLDVPLMVGAALLAYLLTQRFGPEDPHPAGVRRRDPRRGRDRPARRVPVHLRLPGLDVVRPELSWTAIVTATPVLVA